MLLSHMLLSHMLFDAIQYSKSSSELTLKIFNLLLLPRRCSSRGCVSCTPATHKGASTRGNSQRDTTSPRLVARHPRPVWCVIVGRFAPYHRSPHPPPLGKMPALFCLGCLRRAIVYDTSCMTQHNHFVRDFEEPTDGRHLRASSK